MKTKNPIALSPSSVPLIKRLVSTYLRPYTRQVLGAVLCLLIAASMTALFARLIQPVMDDVLSRAGSDPSARAMILPIGLSIFTCFAVRGLAGYGQTVQMSRIGQWIIRDIQNDLFRHLVRLDLGFHNANPAGQLTSRMVSDVNVMRAAVTDALAGIASSALTLLFLIIVMIIQDWQLSLIAFITLPVASFLVSYLGKKLRNISKSIQDHTATLTDRLAEVFSGIRMIQSYGLEQTESARMAGTVEQVRKHSIKSVRVSEMLTPINEILIGITVFTIIVYGGYKIAHGDATPGSLMSFIAAFALAYEPMKKLGKMNNVLQLGLGAAERVFALMDTPTKMTDTPDAQPLTLSSPPTITFDHVSFQYHTNDTLTDPAKTLSDIDLIFPSGKVTALVGPSGGGKSTLINLILRFYDPSAGRIFINGDNMRSLTIDSVRSHMALVSQDVTLFNATVRDNILLGRMDADMAMVIAAARAAAAHDFIMELPNGYDTIIGASGVLLSGGQRQRLSIARAMLRNAPILLLDEATSALDNESERAIQESLSALQSGRTTIVIAHRLSTIRHADQIVVMDGGRVIEAGRHDELIAHGGMYARLHGTFEMG